MIFFRSIGAYALAASLSAGCAQVAEPKTGCQKDNECASGSACSVGLCVPRIKAETRQTWALEVVPKTESPWASTENPAVTFTGDPAQLRVEDKKVITGEIPDIDSTLASAAMRVLFSLPSSIGKGERQFEAEASRPPYDRTRLVFSISIPESAVGKSARITLFPSPPLDQALPVWTEDLATLGPTVIINLPKVSVIEGVLQDELEQPVPGYEARALVGERLVSTVVTTTAQGRFQLKIANSPANVVNLEQVRVELTPADPMLVSPRIETTLTAMKLNLGILRLPPRPKALMLDIPVTALGSAGKKLPGVTLRFSAELPMAFGGKAFLVREFQTDKDGVAHVSLLPGNAGAIRDYAVSVLPPANSKFAARCIPKYSVATPPAGQARTGASIELGNKREISGQVTDGAGAPQSGVIMTATPHLVTDMQVCGMVLPPPGTVTTGLDGGYRLSLDPGRYRIEYEPPMGSPSTMLVENDVSVDQTAVRGKVALPGGLVATGLVKDDRGDGVLGCEVRVFGRPTAGRLPELRARTRTTVDGRFMIVLPENP